ncbi:MAG: AbrB/MazE/SpoVT family DNA-binding domain-containing protein [Panacagrimonas sp.]
MLSKLTSKNQLTLPKAVISQFPDTEYFEVSAERGRIVLKPFRRSRADEVREKIAKLGITEKDIDDAVEWARNQE